MRWLLLLILAFLIWRLWRAFARPGRPSAPPGITDLRACARCETYVDSRELLADVCASCRKT